MYSNRIVSGMRPTGAVHLGHYHGALKNWVKLQSDSTCLFFVADWHALTTHYSNPSTIRENILEMIIDWLAVGIDPKQAILFIQSCIPEHAELHLLLSMLTPLGWLERVPTYKDQKEKLVNRNLATYGFLGYPVLQAADVLIYRASHVPVGEDQISHIEIIREIARRFNYLYGKEEGFEEKARKTIKKLGVKCAKLYIELRSKFQDQGDKNALKQAQKILDTVKNLPMIDRERLFSYLEGSRKLILTEPQALLTQTSLLPGLDGMKMSKSYGNTITLREGQKSLTQKIRMMPTDPKRVYRTDPGDPNQCPVWQFHIVYSDSVIKKSVELACRSARISCIECKQLIIDTIIKEQQPILERAQKYIDDPSLVRVIIADGCDNARKLAKDTMRDVREVMGLSSF